MASYPLINGVRYDFSSIEARIGASAVALGFKEISYSHKLEPGEVRGSSAQLIARTRGEYSCEASASVYKQEWKELVLDVYGAGFMETAFDLAVTFADVGQPTMTDTIVGCRIKSAENSLSQGSDALMVKFDLHPMYILENGVAPLVTLRR